jgi:iron complex transport system permease protein
VSRRPSPPLTLALLLAFSLGSLPAALLLGAVPLELGRALHDSTSSDALILWQVRAPRALLGWTAGAALSLAGLLLQALFRNPLASPYTLGISSGAALGAGLALSAGGLPALGLLPEGARLLGAQGGALAGAALAGALVWALGRRAERGGAGGLLLAGVALNFTLASLLLLLQVLADPSQSLRILRWLMGGLDAAAWGQLPAPALVLALALPLAWGGARQLDLLSLGEETAHGRGLRLPLLTGGIFWLSSLLVAVLVAATGPIGFVGLMAPHAARLLVGPGHRRLIPAALALGSGFLVLADAAARTALAPAELPVGVITACLGGPVFLLMLLRRT